MDFEGFQEFILESAARHDAAVAQHDAAIAQHNAAIARHDGEIADIRDSIKSMVNTVDRLVDNQVFLQGSLQELERIVFRHATDPGAHNVN